MQRLSRVSLFHLNQDLFSVLGLLYCVCQYLHSYMHQECVIQASVCVFPNTVVHLLWQAIAVVFGFLVTAALIIILVFALKTRQKIQNYGKSNILWRRVKEVDEVAPPQDVEAWVSLMICSVNKSPIQKLA